MRVKNIEEARAQAQANANQAGEPWVIFTDTSGNIRVERLSTQESVEVFYPESKD